MADIRVVRKHTAGKQAAMEAALRVAERMKEKAQVSYRVSGDVLEFDRSGAKGRIVVSDEMVEVEVTLGLMLKPMRTMIEAKMSEYFERYLK